MPAILFSTLRAPSSNVAGRTNSHESEAAKGVDQRRHLTGNNGNFPPSHLAYLLHCFISRGLEVFARNTKALGGQLPTSGFELNIGATASSSLLPSPQPKECRSPAGGKR